VPWARVKVAVGKTDVERGNPERRNRERGDPERRNPERGTSNLEGGRT
jgi:hypothetical protein